MDLQEALGKEPLLVNLESLTGNSIPAEGAEAAPAAAERAALQAAEMGRTVDPLSEKMLLTMDVAEAVLLEMTVATAIKVLPLFETQGRRRHELCAH